jgi:thiol-disulfide isomerase/thioredoxin
MLRNKLAVIIITISVTLTNYASANDFSNERYLGWYWFEEKAPVVSSKDSSNNELLSQQAEITSLQAKAEIEQFAKELEDLKFMMLARPSVENVKAYRDKEKQMWSQAMTLHDAWDMTNLLYPNQRDLINNPVNVHAVKAKRELVRSQDGEKIKQLAKEFDLVLFFDPNCTYCKLLSPVLASFGEQYGFNIEAISTTNVK